MTLPTDEQVKKRLGELLDAKDYKTAAQLILYHCFCKIDPDEFVDMLMKKAQEFKEKHAREQKPSST